LVLPDESALTRNVSRTAEVSDRRLTATPAEADDHPTARDLGRTERGGGSLHRLVRPTERKLIF
jgi:hypothetical protein